MFTRIRTLRALNRLFPNSKFELEEDDDNVLNIIYDAEDEMEMYAFSKKRVYDICDFYLKEDFILRKAEEDELRFTLADLMRCTRFTFKEKIKILEALYLPKKVSNYLLKDDNKEDDEND